jgi:hypothetical protein
MLRVLAEEPPPTRLDAEFLARAGRKRVRARRTGVVVAAGAVTALAIGAATVAVPGGLLDRDAGPPAGTPTPTRSVIPPIQDAPCTVEALPSPKGNIDLGIAAMDDSGRYILGMYGIGSTQTSAVLWVDGEPRMLPQPSGSLHGWTGVNGSGVLIGASTSGGQRRPWVYRNGSFTRLALPTGAIGGEAVDLNDAGQIVGTAEWRSTTPGDVGVIKALRWQIDTPDSVEVLPSTTKWTEPRAIAADGTIVGTLDDGRPYLWHPDGRGEPLPGYNGDDRGKAMDIAGDFAAGWTYAGASQNGPSTNVRWNVKTGQVMSTGTLEPMSVAANGTVAGRMGFGGSYAALERDGITYILPLLDIPGRTGHPYPSQISADGRTVTGTHSTPTHNVPTRWKCEA